MKPALSSNIFLLKILLVLLISVSRTSIRGELRGVMVES